MMICSVAKQPAGFYPAVAAGVERVQVFADANVVSYMVTIQIFDPALADKFAVGKQAVSGVLTEQADIPVNHFDTLIGVRVAPLIEQRNHSGESNALAGYGKRQHVNVGLAQLPAGSVLLLIFVKKSDKIYLNT
jgi:hypothetical protein